MQLDRRATAEVQPDGESRVYGVDPGAIAGNGPNPPTAFANLRMPDRRYRVEVAFDSPELKTFQGEIERDFHETTADAVAEGGEARRRTSSGEVSVGPMSLDTSERTPRVRVANLHLQPGENRIVSDVQPRVAG